MQIEEILNEENYVEVDPKIKDSCEYRMTHLVKEEIRKHKWNEGTKGRTLTWEEARSEWVSLYKEGYLKFLKSVFKKPSRKKISIKTSYVRRQPVITGGLV